MRRSFVVLLLSVLSLQISAQQKLTEPVWRVKDSTHGRSTFLDSTQFLNGQKHGRSVFYQNGHLLKEQHWQFGKLHGVSREFMGNAYRPKSEEMYFEGELHGKCTYYDYSGDYKIHHFNHGIHVDTSFDYNIRPAHLSGITVYYASGKRKQETNYHLNGKVSRQWYWSDTLGWRHDSMWSFHPNGKRKSVERLASIDPMNSACYYHMNYSTTGIIESEGMRCGQYGNDGEWKYYDSIGRFRARLSFAKGYNHGWFITYYPNGKEQLKSFCYKGFTDTVIIYNEAGKIIPPENPEFENIFKAVSALGPVVSLRNPNWYTKNLDRKAVISAWPIRYTPEELRSLPSFPGGPDSLNAFFRRNIVYPRSDVSLGREGEIYFDFTVQPDGTITDVYSSYSDPMESLLDKEARRVFFLMPKWIPAFENGKKVAKEFSFQVKFQLRPKPE